jgi:hypothetical protein
MSSRMEKYYALNEQPTIKRSDRNVNIYNDLKEINNYSNIEGIATIDNSNEIDITKIKKMIESRENYQKEKDLRKVLTREKELLEENKRQASIEEIKSYDLKDLFDQAKKDDNNHDNKYKKLNKVEYDVSKKISSSKNLKEQEDDQNSNIENEDAGLLDDLMSDTMVGDAESIKIVLEEAKEKTLDINSLKEENTFFTTSSLGFTKNDFEDLKGIDNQKKQKKPKIIVFITIPIILIVVAIILILTKVI